MSKLDKIKESINQFRFWLGALVATDIGLLGWLVSNYETQSLIKLIASVAAICGLSIVIVAIEKKIRKNIEEIEEL